MSTPTNTVKRVKSTKKYRALLAALGGDETAALNAYHAAEGTPVQETPQADDSTQALLDAGFTQEQVSQVLAAANKPKKGKKDKDAKPSTKGEELVAKAGLTFSRGRVYATPAIIEAQVRVLKTGRPEVVKTSGAGRVHSVLIFRTDSGDAAIQNCIKPV